MPNRTEWAVYLALGLVVAVFCALLWLGGPVGWLFAGVLLLLVALLAKWSELLPDGDGVARVSCPACGARNGRDRASCHHCGAPLDGESRRGTVTAAGP